MKKMSSCDPANVWRPVYWNGLRLHGRAQDHLKAFSLSNGMLSSTWVYESPLVLHPYRCATLSANGSENGIFWLVRNTNSTAKSWNSRRSIAVNV